MLPHRWLLLLLLAASVAAAGETNMSLGSSSARPRHNLAHLWSWQSVVGLVGVVLNSAVFYAFIRERQNMARPVNVLVWWVVGWLTLFPLAFNHSQDAVSPRPASPASVG